MKLRRKSFQLIFCPGKKASVCYKPDLQGFDRRNLFTIWVTNGIANSSCNLLCTLIMSWLKGFTQTFPNINLFLPPNTSQGSEKGGTPFVLWVRKLGSEKVMCPTKVTLQAHVLPNPLFPATDTPGTHTGNFVQDVFHAGLELPPHFTWVTFPSSSSKVSNKQNKSMLLLQDYEASESEWIEAHLCIKRISCKQILLITLRGSGGGWFICFKSWVEHCRENVHTWAPDCRTSLNTRDS